MWNSLPYVTKHLFVKTNNLVIRNLSFHHVFFLLCHLEWVFSCCETFSTCMLSISIFFVFWWLSNKLNFLFNNFNVWWVIWIYLNFFCLSTHMFFIFHNRRLSYRYGNWFRFLLTWLIWFFNWALSINYTLLSIWKVKELFWYLIWDIFFFLMYNHWFKFEFNLRH